MNILALETSSEHLSVALAASGGVLAREFSDPVPHSERVLESVQALLAEAGVTVRDLHGVAFGAGPGAFTGVRLGCGVAQGLALARSIPVVAVNSLQALAEACAGHDPNARAGCVTAIDARLGELYVAAWQHTDRRWTEVVTTRLATAEDVPLPPAGRWIGCGSGFRVHGPALRARLAGRLAEVATIERPSAASVLALAREAFRAGEGVPPEQALPIYIRDKVALTTVERAARAAAGMANR